MSEAPHNSPATYGALRRPHLHLVQPPGPDEPVWAPRLSAREAEVLRCIAAGMSTREIARTLYISVTTVKSHVARLLLKVEARDRVQLVVAAYRSGFLTGE